MAAKSSTAWHAWVEGVFDDRVNRSRPRALRALAEWAAASVGVNNDVYAGISAGYAAVSRAAESPEATIRAARYAIWHAVTSLRESSPDDIDVWHFELHAAGELIGLRLPDRPHLADLSVAG